MTTASDPRRAALAARRAVARALIAPALEALEVVHVNPWADREPELPGSGVVVRQADGSTELETRTHHRPAHAVKAARVRFELLHGERRQPTTRQLRTELAHMLTQVREYGPTVADAELIAHLREWINARRAQIPTGNTTLTDEHALQTHREALASARRDPAERESLTYPNVLLLALAARRDSAHVGESLAVTSLRLTMIFAATLVRALLDAERTAYTLRLRDYFPPTPADMPDSPRNATHTLACAPGAPSAAVCV